MSSMDKLIFVNILINCEGNKKHEIESTLLTNF